MDGFRRVCARVLSPHVTNATLSKMGGVFEYIGEPSRVKRLMEGDGEGERKYVPCQMTHFYFYFSTAHLQFTHVSNFFFFFFSMCDDIFSFMIKTYALIICVDCETNMYVDAISLVLLLFSTGSFCSRWTGSGACARGFCRRT